MADLDNYIGEQSNIPEQRLLKITELPEQSHLHHSLDHTNLLHSIDTRLKSLCQQITDFYMPSSISKGTCYFINRK